MDSKELKFFRVATLPTSNYVVGGIYFVTSEKKIYIRTDTGWESYSNSSGDGGDTSSAYYISVSNLNAPATDAGKEALDGVIAAFEAGTPVFVYNHGITPSIDVTYIYNTCIMVKKYPSTKSNDYEILIEYRNGTACPSYLFTRTATTGAWSSSPGASYNFLTGSVASSVSYTNSGYPQSTTI